MSSIGINKAKESNIGSWNREEAAKKDQSRKQNRQAQQRRRSSSDSDRQQEMKEQNQQANERFRKRQRLDKSGSIVPSDLYLGTFETNINAAKSLHWMKTYNWVLGEFRESDFNSLDGEMLESLKAKMTALGQPSDADIERMMRQYAAIVNPCCPAQCCASCGHLEVKMELDRKEMKFEHFSVGPYHQCRWTGSGVIIDQTTYKDWEILKSLAYTEQQEKEYMLPVPVHIENNDVNRDRWERYKLVKSQVKRLVQRISAGINKLFVR